MGPMLTKNRWHSFNTIGGSVPLSIPGGLSSEALEMAHLNRVHQSLMLITILCFSCFDMSRNV